MSTLTYPGCSDEAHPELFGPGAMPAQPAVKKAGQLPDDKIRQFFEEGYVLVEDFFTPEELEPCRQEILSIVDNLANRLYKAGKIKDLYSDYGLFQRLIKLENDFTGASILCMKLAAMPKSLQNIWSNERLLNMVEQLIGPDIMGHPVWNLRTKVPHHEETTVPWHQDVGYLDNRSYKVLQPTAWIPFLDADETNGCLEFAVKGHKTGKVATHQCCHGGTWYVMLEEDEMEKKLEIDIKKDLKVIPVKYGGMVLFNNLIPHRSLPNNSNVVRWSVDLRWQNPAEPLGFYGLKEGVLLRSSKDPNHKINWEPFDAVDRHDVQNKFVSDKVVDEFDTSVQGPWMKKWEITHINRHVNTHYEMEGITAEKTK